MHAFLTQQDGTLPTDLNNLKATEVEQNAKVAVDRATRSVLVKSVGDGSAVGSPGSAVQTAQGVGFESTAQFTRPNNATPYVALDVVGTDPATVLTFANIGPVGGGKVIIVNARLLVHANAIPSGMSLFRLHLYSTQPTAIADNSAYNLPAGDRAKKIGWIDIPLPNDLGDTLEADCEAQGYTVRKEVTVPAGGTLYGILQTIGGFTPTAQVVKDLTLNAVLV